MNAVKLVLEYQKVVGLLLGLIQTLIECLHEYSGGDSETLISCRKRFHDVHEALKAVDKLAKEDGIIP